VRWLSLLCLFIPVAVSAQKLPEPHGGISSDQRVAALALLWSEVRYNFAYFDQVPDLDWDARFAEYVTEAQNAAGTFELYRVLQRFLAELHDGHTLVFLPDSIVARRPVAAPWVELEEIERRAIVSNVDTALARELPVGSEILYVDGTEVTRYLAEHVFPFMSVSTEHVRWRDAIRGSSRHLYGLLYGPTGTSVRVRARRPDGGEVEVTLRRDRPTRASAWVATPPRRDMLEHRPLDDGLHYVAINSFNDVALVARFDSILPALRDSRGIVLDVRRNRGGVDDVVRQILTRLTGDTLVGPAWRTRTHVAAYRAWGRFADEAEWARQYRGYWSGDGAWHLASPDTVRPHGQSLTVPIAVLTGSETASAAENFLVYVHGHEQFTLVGEPTNGSSGQPLMLDLPGGGRAWICTKRNTYADGRPYIGTGVIPDVRVPLTVADVRAGRDRTLETAVELLRSARRAATIVPSR
jgi:carboxyl-terminal processing protease